MSAREIESAFSASPVAVGYNSSTTRAIVSIFLDSPMRVSPTITRVGNERVRTQGVEYLPTAFSSFYDQGNDLITLAIDVASGLVANQLSVYTIDDKIIWLLTILSFSLVLFLLFKKTKSKNKWGNPHIEPIKS